MTESPLISVLIATYNSASRLPQVIQSLRAQTFPQEQIEILLVDGGSTDSTRDVGRSYGCRIVNNPKINPGDAKLLGLGEARGKYLVYLDHDEILQNPDSLRLRVEAMQADQRIRAVLVSGYCSPQGFPFINDYINEFGEPYSFFIYRLSKDYRFFIPAMRKRYPLLTESESVVTFDLSGVKDLPLIEVGAMGGMVDREYLIENYSEEVMTANTLPHYFYYLQNKLPYISIAKNDVIMHYSADVLGKYLRKIDWRIRNNIYFQSDMGSAGYRGRVRYQGWRGKAKKYLFLPYAYSLLLPFVDSIYLVITRRNPRYFLHMPLCIWTAVGITYHMARKILGHQPKLHSYDGTREVKQK